MHACEGKLQCECSLSLTELISLSLSLSLSLSSSQPRVSLASIAGAILSLENSYSRSNGKPSLPFDSI